MQDTANWEFDLQRDLRNAFVQGGLELFLQPKVCAKSGIIRSAEALVRWRHPVHGLLLPGEFVRARIFAGQVQNGLTVPQRAVSLTESGGTVFVVDREGKAAVRPVELGAMVDGRWIVEGGIRAGDRVIVSNLQKIRPGAPVKVVDAPTGRSSAKQTARAPHPASTGGAD